MTNLYAKINGESLRDHTAKVLDGIKRLRTLLSDSHDSFSHDFWEYLERAAFIHDFGKASENFQGYIKSFIKEKNKERPPVEELIPHSAISPVLCNWFDCGIPDEWQKIILSSVFFHHDRSKLYNIKTSGNIETINESALDSLKKEFEEFDAKFTSFIAGNLKNINYRFLSLVIAPEIISLKKSGEECSLEEVDPRKYIFFKGFLHRADHYASSLEKDDSDITLIEIPPVPGETVEKNVSNKITGGLNNSDSLWQFRELNEKNLRGKNTILIGSTGIGKTEFAFLWGAGKKMFFTLPMRTMTDQIYKRACDIFNSSKENGDKVGLLHSSAATALAKSLSKPDEMETDDIESHIGLSRSMSYPVIVCTGDQVLNISLKYPTYEKIMGTLGYSNLIIDEIQAYSPETSAIIVKTIQETVQMGGNFLLMTATLPDYIKEEIKGRTGLDDSQIISIYSKLGIADIKKHKIQLIKTAECNDDDLRETFLDEIKQIALQNPGKKVLITINTVKQAQAIFRQLYSDNDFLTEASLKQGNLMLLHSRFIGKDREDKVDIITGRKEVDKVPPDVKLLVSTQIIEASVDIDFDILISELAPLDSLIQRMGRVNRNRGEYAPGKGEVYIIDKILKGSASVYKGKTPELTSELLSEKIGAGNILSEKEKQKLLDDYYTHEKYQEIETQFNKNLDALDNLLLASSKSEAQRIFREINSIDVIPFEVYKEFENAMVELWQRYSTSGKKGLKVGIKQLLLNYSTSLRYSEYNEVYPIELSTYLSNENSLCEMKKKFDFKQFFRGYFVIQKESRWKYDSTFGLQKPSKEDKASAQDNIL
jgi:CRISPR-associated endonuclease/helicase Cas3